MSKSKLFKLLIGCGMSEREAYELCDVDSIDDLPDEIRELLNDE